MPRIIVIDDEKNICRTVSMVLMGEDYDVETASSAEDGLAQIQADAFDVAILDVQLGGMSGIELLEKLHKFPQAPEVIMMSGHAMLSDAVNATRLGAFDFLEKPLDRDRLLLSVRNAVERRTLTQKIQSLEDADTTPDFCGILGESPAMLKIKDAITVVAPTKGRVLITGESGVGKDLVARAIHAKSDRAKRSFVKVNCSAIPAELIESELFGHEKGSFTGAAVSKKGLFEMANNGTIFLDEIGDMSLAAQSKVLRVLQNGEYMRVGAEKLSYVDVRVIAATHKDLKKCVADGTFREDLYFRLNVVPIHVPPLRDRLTDVPLLLNAFLAQIAAEYGRTPLSVTDRASELLGQYTYPGNIRELHNICERFVIMCQERVTVDDLPDEVLKLDQKRSDTPANSKPAPIDTNDDDNPMQRLATITPGSMSLRTFRNVAEHAFIRATLNAAAQNVAKAAEILGIERTNLHKKIKKYESNSFDTDESED